MCADKRAADKMSADWHEWGRRDPMWAISTFDDKKDGRWDAEEFFATGEQDVKRILTHVAKVMPEYSHGRALDFGCGIGRLTQALAQHFEEVQGVDVAPSMIEQAAAHNRRENCAYFLNVSTDLSAFSSNDYDFLLCRAVLQHIRPPLSRRYIKEFLRILKPGGVLVFQLHDSPKKEFITLKSRLLAAVPPSLLYCYRDLKRSVLRQVYMEMHGIPKAQVVQLVEESGGSLVDIVQDETASGAWLSYEYYVRKPLAED